MPRTRHHKAKLGKAHLGFADAYPLLVISWNSLADLNFHLEEHELPTVGIERFRPNIFVDGCDPYTEDRMARFEIGSVHFTGETLCARCSTVNTDQSSGDYDKEGPLTVLAGYRRNPQNGGGVVFGRNVNHLTMGQINVGDEVKVTKWDNPWENGV
ncbi:MAG TPA: MOSC domain-containing protein [Patescibacteria group bacterium]|nr:MOSC domain-containing protein [Patescibacteria group bacterium]